MAYQLSTLVTNVQNRLDDTGFSAEIIKQFINDAQRDYLGDKRWRFMEETADFTATIGSQLLGTLPDDYEMPITLRVTTPYNAARILNFMDYKDVDRIYPAPTLLGNTLPFAWYEFANTIYLLPAAGQAYTLQLRYIKVPTELSADADVPVIPEEFQELLVLGALWRCHEFNDDYDKAALTKVKESDLLTKLNKRYGVRQLGQRSIMRRGI